VLTDSGQPDFIPTHHRRRRKKKLIRVRKRGIEGGQAHRRGRKEVAWPRRGSGEIRKKGKTEDPNSRMSYTMNEWRKKRKGFSAKKNKEVIGGNNLSPGPLRLLTNGSPWGEAALHPVKRNAIQPERKEKFSSGRVRWQKPGSQPPRTDKLRSGQWAGGREFEKKKGKGRKNSTLSSQRRSTKGTESATGEGSSEENQ